MGGREVKCGPGEGVTVPAGLSGISTAICQIEGIPCGSTGLPGSRSSRVTVLMRHVLTVVLLVILVSGCAGPVTPGRGRVSGMVGGWPAHPTGGEVAPAAGR